MNRKPEPETAGTETVAVGVIGVGSMGEHHARVYESLPGVEVVGVADADAERAAAVGEEYGVPAAAVDSILATADAVSVAVPTRFHHDVVTDCLESGCDVLVEKPLVREVPKGRELIRTAEHHDVILQVGHIERFNPAVRKLPAILEGHEIIALDAKRMGPPLDREVQDSAVLDLMIHDIDIVCSLLDASPTSIFGAGVRGDKHATATLVFDSEVVAELTASRLTQKKLRQLDIVTEECLIRVDYIDQSIELHRASTPEYIREDENVRYRHESIVERPMIESTEPLRNELVAFTEAVRTRSEPVVTAEDALKAVQICQQIERSSASGAEAIDFATMEEVNLD